MKRDYPESIIKKAHKLGFKRNKFVTDDHAFKELHVKLLWYTELQAWVYEKYGLYAFSVPTQSTKANERFQSIIFNENTNKQKYLNASFGTPFRAMLFSVKYLINTLHGEVI